MIINNLGNDAEARLRERAVAHGRSVEEEACSILRAALFSPEETSSGATLVRAIRTRMHRLGGIDLELPERGPAREPPDFPDPESNP